MRTQNQIESIISEAKLAYSYLIQIYEEKRQRGLVSDLTNLVYGLNILNAIPVSDSYQKELFCDALIANGFTLSATQKLFTEEIYNEDFDTI